MLYSLIKLVGHRDLGFILGLVVVFNLAIGSLVMNIYTDLYPPFFPFDLNYFFDPVRIEHSWLYALIITFTLYGINLSACLIESAVELIQSKSQRLHRTAALLIHLALLLTMGAHLVDGFYGQTQHGVISQEGVLIPGIGLVRTEYIENIQHPDGSLKDTKVGLKIERANGEKINQTIAYNEPAIFDNGEWEIIIQSGENKVRGFIIKSDNSGQEISLTTEIAKQVGSGSVTLQGMINTQMGPFAQLTWQAEDGTTETKIIALTTTAGRHSSLTLGQEVFQFKELTYRPMAAVMVRYNPAILLIALALFISTIGLIMLKPVWWRREH
ncbi:MAG: hypothetical protein L3J28_01215 [Candidatus Polarisedimenticolaceae bacterium]|nr:hypothetical protein [Candidatus Polarisedimenticolaceae bacterium]